MSQKEGRFSSLALIAVAVVSITGTVVALELAGRIDHGTPQGEMGIGDFTAVHVKPGETLKMSPKNSELHSLCIQGYLAIASDVDPDFRGMLVDYKNRGVRCLGPQVYPAEPTGARKP